jgi:formyl-CoA transferase
MGGLYEPSRKPDQPPPVVVAGALGDVGTALFAVIGTLAALRHRERTGLGQHVDVSMFDAMLAISDMPPHLWSMGAPERWAASGSLGVCAGFRARDGHFVVAVFREHQFQKLARAVGHPEWCQDPRFATREGWALHTDAVIRPALEEWARDKSKLEASRALCDQGIVAGPSNTAADLAEDPHVALRDMLIEVPRTDAERPFLVVGNPFKLSRVARPVRSASSLGQHTDEAARGSRASDAEIAGLRTQGAIGWRTMPLDPERWSRPHTASPPSEIQRRRESATSSAARAGEAGREIAPAGGAARGGGAACACAGDPLHRRAARRQKGMNRNARLFGTWRRRSRSCCRLAGPRSSCRR